jgi:DNA-binding XRE family transcriptional regulator
MECKFPVSFRTMKKSPEKKIQKLIDETQQALAQRLYDLRTERSLTQTELSVLAGIDRKTINRIENGHFAPSVDTLVRLSMVMSVPVTDFLS